MFIDLCSFWRDRKGTTAIEFSLLAIPFVTFVIGIIELALMGASASLLQGAMSDAARLVRTGQVQQTSGDPQQMFADALCAKASVLLNCSNIQYSVERLDAFSDANPAPDVDEDGNLVNTQFDPGASRDVVLIRVAYGYRFMTPLIGNVFSNYANNTRLLVSSMVLETEPYYFGD
ncbi:MAG: pilus assembly protein [Rhodospirillales bacterium]|nr:pilus assembly protein [Rhodospirillales bacterium]